jgi:hypothetical protein
MSDNTTLNPGVSGDAIRDVDRSGVKTQVVLMDVGGQAGPESLVTLANPHPIQPAATSFVFSASGQNTTTTQLAAAATFTGTVESTSSQQCISILLTCDQPGTLTIEQFIDSGGTFKTNSWVYTTAANVPFSRNFTANGNYARVKFTNTGASTTTTLNLNTAYGTLPAVDDLGNSQVSLNEVNGTALTLGQKVMASSIPVVLASDQTAVIVQGGAASGASVAGNPNLIAGTFSTTQPTVTTGQAVTAQYTARGEALVALSNGAVAVAVKAASTAAAFTDPALTVDPRPGGALVTASAAMADAFANPTLGKQAVVNMVYNGSTWDLQRGMSGALTTGDTGAKTATGNGATQTNVGNKGAQIVVNMGAVSGTTPTCTIKIQGSVDGGTTWFDVPGATTAPLVATGVFGITVYPGIAVTAGGVTSGTTAGASGVLPRSWRVVWTIGGTTPSFTITNIQVNYLPN